MSRPAIFAAGHWFTRTHRSRQVFDLLEEEWSFRNVLILMIIAVGTYSIVWCLWQTIGIKKTFCFLAIFYLGHWKLSSDVTNDTVWGLLLILLALPILLASLLGVWNFAGHALYRGSFNREIGSPILVAMVLVLAAGITVSLFFLLMKMRLPVRDKPH